jgi:hypothetical protein
VNRRIKSSGAKLISRWQGGHELLEWRVDLKQVLSAGVLVTVVSMAIAGAEAQQPAPPVVTATVGPQVGATVPPLSGVDQFGKAQTLASLSGPKGLMLVFSRSADW